ncbi:hypothetical protein [Rhodococcus sp. (in: high G+C Gram-positive bacteria)]|nr:hypothetical protein [Rhodococcus sp. (in: high G+C Gram-positive bacteria)]
MTPPAPHTHPQKRRHGLLVMTVEAAIVIACVAAAITIVWWAA